LCIAFAFGSAIATLLLLGAYAVISDGLRRPVHQPVAFSELLAEIDAGHIEEIRIKNQRYTFRLRGSDPNSTITREAIGPAATETDAPALKPSDPGLSAPKLVFEPR